MIIFTYLINFCTRTDFFNKIKIPAKNSIEIENKKNFFFFLFLSFVQLIELNRNKGDRFVCLQSVQKFLTWGCFYQFFSCSFYLVLLVIRLFLCLEWMNSSHTQEKRSRIPFFFIFYVAGYYLTQEKKWETNRVT